MHISYVKPQRLIPQLKKSFQHTRKLGEMMFVGFLSQRLKPYTYGRQKSIFQKFVSYPSGVEKAEPLRFATKVMGLYSFPRYDEYATLNDWLFALGLFLNGGTTIEQASRGEFMHAGCKESFLEWHYKQVLKLAVFIATEETHKFFPQITEGMLKVFIESPFFASCSAEDAREEEAKVRARWNSQEREIKDAEETWRSRDASGSEFYEQDPDEGGGFRRIK
jgi:hypothetical protein